MIIKKILPKLMVEYAIFNNQTLFENINKVKNNNNQSEYYLPDVLEILTKQNYKVLVYQINDENEIKAQIQKNNYLI